MMEVVAVIAIVLAVVAITVVVYDFNQRKHEIGDYYKAKTELEISMKALSETNNKAVENAVKTAEQIELINLKLSGLVSNSNSNKRV